jgi:phytoene synthase
MTVAPVEPAASARPPAAPTAARSSFYAALRILPAEQRQAMFQVYDFCRAVDDIADEGGPRSARLAELARWRADLAGLYAGRGVAPGLAGLAGPIDRFGLAQADFDAVIDGMVMDAEADIRAPDWATLDLYCDRVASAVGRLSVRIFGVPAEQRGPLAHHLGRALQLTNILRDLDEDAALGRLYLPREALAAAGIAETEPARAVMHPDIAAACAHVVARARDHFAEAARIMDACPRATVRSPRLMAAVYRRILDDLVGQGFAPPRKRVRVAKARVLWAVLRHGLF